ncbi:hypothetical protein CONPUDRAFT_145250 [Coniophora puteana RWD-64-598 SS2]|uniref:Peptidase S54 rhomboid domain-containing protein n=1 Tax=Coniophora puteana (strain RWD-64-598) TaxID=741705 RepID=A0A5M3MJB1_CONPW|nr:uncharacterized protein CONPUDRAFT_145250 [Coniophora puteana RWD-64-598 SS2]EIW79077.1 hypothetical protein CONPUDRAFT_145250 [Coniophora puteana RWD-64-598 SS2]
MLLSSTLPRRPPALLSACAATRSFARTVQRALPRTSRIAEQKATHVNAVPSFREQVARTAKPESFRDRVQWPSAGRQVMFALGASGLFFAAASLKTEEETEFWRRHTFTFLPWQAPHSASLHHAVKVDIYNKLSAGRDSLERTMRGWPIALQAYCNATYVALANAWLNAHEGRRVCWTLCAANAAVWVLWRVPRLQGFMSRSFTHHPLSGRSYTLLTSVFSHKSFLHLAANSFALASFGTATWVWMRNENVRQGAPVQSTDSYHFLAFFLSAGLFAGLVSHVATTKIIFPRLVARMSQATQSALDNVARPTAAHTAAEAAASAGNAGSSSAAAAAAARPILPSLGASGAIYACLTLNALAWPHAEMSLVFPPLPFGVPLRMGAAALVAMDITGLVRGWRLFDHWAHLGGAAFGVGYYAYGTEWWEWWRDLWTEVFRDEKGWGR